MKKNIRTYSSNTDLVNKRREHIVKNATRLFALKGYDKTSVREIANVCGLNHATIYHYVGSKEDILRLVVQAAFEMPPDIEQQDFLLDESICSTDKLRLVIRSACKNLDKYFDYALVVMRDINRFPRDIRKTILYNEGKHWALYETILCKGCQNGDFRIKDIPFVARNISTIIEAWVARRWIYKNNYKLDEFIERQTEFIIDSITNKDDQHQVDHRRDPGCSDELRTTAKSLLP